MKTNHVITFGLAALISCISGCSQDDELGSDEANANEADGAYAFDLWDCPLDKCADRIDSMGVALTSTALTNRDRKPANGPFKDDGAGEYNNNKYQNAAPHVALFLPIFAHYLAKMHSEWDAQLSKVGFEPCSVARMLDTKTIAGETVQVLPCTTQKLGTNASDDGPRVLDVVLPDYVTLNVDKPLGFPNGRILDEQVNDTVLAMGFLKMEGDCRGDTSGKARTRPYRTGEEHVIGTDGKDLGGVPLCNVETFKNVGLNPTKNDRNNGEFSPNFPYLVSPWFYKDEAPEGGLTYWPTKPRQSTP